jgi:hypothetical protein
LIVLKTITYLIKVIVTYAPYISNLAQCLPPIGRNIVLFLGLTTWLMAIILSASVSSAYKTTLNCTPSFIDLDIARIGVCVSIYINAVIVSVSILLGLFHLEKTSVIEVAALLWVTLVIYIFNI